MSEYREALQRFVDTFQKHRAYSHAGLAALQAEIGYQVDAAKALLARPEPEHPAEDEIARARQIVAAASNGVEWGVVSKPIDEHVEDFRTSLSWPTNTGNRLHGVYLAGTETVVCHTGNGPTSEANAIAITFALNNMGKLLDQIERIAVDPAAADPLPMILHCPSCHAQHIDEPDERTPEWSNPPHRSHLCHQCGTIWRPADVATVGVREIKTKGKADTALPAAAEKAREQVKAINLPGYVKPDTAERVHFYEQEFYVLSNFSAFSLRWKGFKFATSEQAYHWEKFEVDSPSQSQLDIQALIIVARSAHDAFKLAERHKAERRADWDGVKVGIMRNILRAKVDQHEYVRRKLLETGDRELVEDSWRDPFWGWGPNRDGQNMLGKLWMEIRDELRNAPSPPAATGEK